MRRKLLTMCAAAGLLAIASAQETHANVVHFEGFEDPGWAAGQPGNWQNWHESAIARVPTGTNGIASSAGDAHGQLAAAPSNSANQLAPLNTTAPAYLGPFTQFGGYSNTFGNGFSTSLDIYLDPSWGNGQGFDYSSAANQQDGNHLRDFIWHVGVVDSLLKVNASNNSPRGLHAGNLNNLNDGNFYEVSTAGWYTFENVFYANGGLLYVDFNLYNSIGDLVHTITRGGNADDDIATTVGGNRYGWFVYNNIDGLAIDNTTLRLTQASLPVPEPAVAGMVLVGMAGLIARRRRLA